MGARTLHPWVGEHLPPGERADLLLAELSVDEKTAQVSCYFPTGITQTKDFSERFPFGIGEVSCLEARSALTRDQVTAFQRNVQEAAMAGSGHGIPAIFHMEGLCGVYLPGATSFPSGIGRAANWDADLEYKVAQIVGK